MSRGQQTAVVLGLEVGGAAKDELAKELLTEAWVDDERNLPDACALVFTDQQGTVLSDGGFTIGAELELRVLTESSENGTVIFKGEITALEAEIDHGTRHTIVRGYDPIHRLQRGTHTETHLDMTYGDIASRVAQRRGLQAGDGGSMNAVHEAVVQWNQSDWEFLQQLAAEVGHETVVADGKLHFREPTAASSAPEEGSPDSATERQLVADNIRRLRATMNSADQVGSVEVRGWDPAAKAAVVGTARAARSSSNQGGADPADLGATFGEATLVRAHLPVESVEMAESAAKSIVEQLGSVAAEIEGIVDGDPTLRSGVTISLSSLGDEFNGKYTITSCRHVFSQAEGYETHFRVSGRQTRTMLGLVGGGSRRNGGGIVSGVVTDVADPEDRGRVKVSFPWLHDDVESPWSRVLSPGGGPDRGIVFLPEVNDEVLVGFDHGDVRMPYVLGCLHNGQDKQPSHPGALVESGKVERRTLVSREGQHLTFDDSDKSIRLATKDDEMKLTFEGADTTITMSADGAITIESGGDLTLKGGGDVLVESTGDMAIVAGAALDIEAGSDVTIRAGANVSIDAGAAFEAAGISAKVAGSASAEISASGATTVKGATVMIN